MVAYVQSDNTFRVVFDTTGLSPGTYKVEVPAGGTGDSITIRQVMIVNRSDEIILTSQTTQALSGYIYLTGQIATDISSGVQVGVIGPDNGVIYGPTYTGTDSLGRFNLAVPVSEAGNYDVSFTDAGGYIGTRTIRIIGENETVAQETTATPTNAESVTVSPTVPAAFVAGQSSLPTTTQAPLVVGVCVIALAMAVLCIHLRRN